MKITKQQHLKTQRKLSREEELANNGGRWVQKHKVHKSKKNYTRKSKHKSNY